LRNLFTTVLREFFVQLRRNWRAERTYKKVRQLFPSSSHLHPKKISSEVDNWYLDDSFEAFICGRWYIYLEQTIYYLCRPISCWLSSLAVEYHLLWTIISYVAWYSSRADDVQLKQIIILIWRRRYLSRAYDIHPMETILIKERRISSMMVDFWNYNQPLEMIFNHWGP
jgi:hypothetical protein